MQYFKMYFSRASPVKRQDLFIVGQKNSCPKTMMEVWSSALTQEEPAQTENTDSSLSYSPATTSTYGLWRTCLTRSSFSSRCPCLSWSKWWVRFTLSSTVSLRMDLWLKNKSFMSSRVKGWRITMRADVSGVGWGGGGWERVNLRLYLQ